MCADCAVEVGGDGWCDGHEADGARYRAWAAGLPHEWPTVVRLWWAATGELDVDAGWLAVARDEVADAVAAALPGISPPR